MNKEKKRLFALFIIGTFLLSTIAFVVTGITGGQQETQKTTELNSYVIEGDIDAQTEYQYASRGFTFLKFYYNETPPAFLDALPYAFPAGRDIQLYVLKIPDIQNYARIVNIQNDFRTENVTEESIVNDLCSRLIVVPVECSFRTAAP